MNAMLKTERKLKDEREFVYYLVDKIQNYIADKDWGI